MLRELAAQSGATLWAIGSMLFFLGVWVLIVVSVFRTRPEDMEARARLALDGDGGSPAESPSDAGTKA